jgi:hypothetical protein
MKLETSGTYAAILCDCGYDTYIDCSYCLVCKKVFPEKLIRVRNFLNAAADAFHV